MIDKSREMFEEVYPLPDNICWSEDTNSYIGLDIKAPWWLWNDRYEVWVKSRAYLTVVLPDTTDDFGDTDSEYVIFDHDQAIKSLREQGVSFK